MTTPTPKKATPAAPPVVRYVGPSGALFVPKVDRDTLKGQIQSGEWRRATADEVKRFLEDGTHAEPTRQAPEDED
jgi:hypothetical protein